ncbi:hypothetical protein FACS1894174_03400 [Bacteroidia bacterium]|nr:hypothetical protein FACS1894174_03400 [Bacteroidia bacterium]
MDTANIKLKKKDIMLLDIGSELSKYYSHAAYFIDSLVVSRAPILENMVRQGVPDKQISDFASDEISKLPRSSGTHDYTILKNCPPNKLNLIDRFARETYRYEEDIPVFNWELKDDTVTVCGYLCKKATTTFRGRDYEAWYAPQIPIPLGPWKFAGLPGLILRIKDVKNMFFFVCTHMTKPEDTRLIKSDNIYSRAFMVDKSKYNKEKQKFMNNPGSVVISGPKPSANYLKKRPFNPIELTEK